MKLNSNKEIIQSLHAQYFPFNRLSTARLNEAEDLLRVFKLKKDEHIEVSVNHGDYFYVLTGSVQVVFDSDEETVINAKEIIGKPINIPQTTSIIQLNTLEDSILCHIENESIGQLLSWDGFIASQNDEQQEIYESIGNLRKSLFFQRLSLECVEKVFKRLKTITVKKGDEIIRQGEKGDTFYIIESGQAEVWVAEEFEEEPEKRRELGPNDSFGEYALLADDPRSATVRMIEDGVLLALEKQDFLEFFSKSIVREVDPNVAKAMINSGSELIDVRFEEEYHEVYIPGTTLISLDVFRDRMKDLDKNKKYVVYCRNGKRSNVAALLMSEQGFDAVSMRGGIVEWPFEKKGLSMKNAPPLKTIKNFSSSMKNLLLYHYHLLIIGTVVIIGSSLTYWRLNLPPGIDDAARQAGEQLAHNGRDQIPACVLCHGANGEGNFYAGFPRLAGLHPGYIAKQLQDFARDPMQTGVKLEPIARDYSKTPRIYSDLTVFTPGTRKDATMNAIAKALTPTDIQNLAVYFGSLPFEVTPQPVDFQTLERGADLALRGKPEYGMPSCISCHGPDGRGFGPHFPPLAGQPPQYIINQINKWQTGERDNDNLALMQNIANQLTDGDKLNAAAYFSNRSLSVKRK